MTEANLKLADSPEKITKKGTETKNLGQKMQLLRKALMEQTAIYMAILFLARQRPVQFPEDFISQKKLLKCPYN